MMNLVKKKEELGRKGYTVIDAIFTNEEIRNILTGIDLADKSGDKFRKSADVFAIRQFLKEVPTTIPFLFNKNLTQIIQEFFGDDYFVVKSIYFDKPESSNWYVAYHQDLTISVEKKIETPGFGPWTSKQNQFAVQPPIGIMENIFTIRIHLDDTDENNGALKVVPGSHAKGVCRPETIDWSQEKEETCCVNTGSVMIMKPLLLHSSGRTTSGKKRRVIHVEFSNLELPTGLN